MTFPQPLEFGANEGLRWTCAYTNPTDDPVTFGVDPAHCLLVSI